jgi:hypothetical protein
VAPTPQGLVLLLLVVVVAQVLIVFLESVVDQEVVVDDQVHLRAAQEPPVKATRVDQAMVVLTAQVVVVDMPLQEPQDLQVAMVEQDIYLL